MTSHWLLSALLVLSVCWTALTTGRMTGGWHPLDTNDENVKNLTHLAVDRYNKQSNSITMKQLVNIKSAMSQVVAGRKYAITFAIGETNCSKNGIQRNNNNECPLTNTSTIETCTVTIWQRVWLNSTQILDIKCCPSDNTVC